MNALLVGLGNPGIQYEGTRHNLGFSVLEKLAGQFRADVWKKEHGVRWTKQHQLWLIEPDEFMNNSGPSLKKFFEHKKIPFDGKTVVVVHDDLDFPLGTIKVDVDRTSGGHQGVQSIIDAFGTQNFRRLRLGIGDNRLVNLPAEAYVLQKFSDNEKPAVEKMIEAAVQQLANLQ